jgi:nitroreductase/NAD-dependent dihydropyrimidine dehydrogenase PreA subunit
MAMTWKELEEIIRPDQEFIHMGKMKVDPEKCTGCGLCIKNCLFLTWEMGEDNVPRFKENWPCFSCYNCMVACPEGAISVAEPYHVTGGFWETKPNPKLPAVMPLQPQDAEGKPDTWNEVERVVYTRRTVRNYADKPVPEPLIRRVLEAGRASPTSGNCQAWQFVVITDKQLIAEMDKASLEAYDNFFKAYMDEEGWKELAVQYLDSPITGLYDPRLTFGGIGKSLVFKGGPVLLGAPAVIILAADQRAIGTPELQVGICGQNMTLVANSLGLRASYVGFIIILNDIPGWLERLGIEEPFKIVTAVVLGYQKFKQEGPVPREFRPITWFREGKKGPEVEESPAIPEIKKW